LGIKNFYPSTRLRERDTVLGHYYFTKHEWKQAVSHLNEAVKQQPKDESIWIYLAKSLIYIGARDRAKECFDQVIKIKIAKEDFQGAEDILKEADSMSIDCNSPLN